MEKITLRALRINFGLTTKEIADKFNIGEQGVARYERDTSTIPAKLLQEFADFYGVSVEQIHIGKMDDLREIIQPKLLDKIIGQKGE